MRKEENPGYHLGIPKDGDAQGIGQGELSLLEKAVLEINTGGKISSQQALAVFQSMPIGHLSLVEKAVLEICKSDRIPNFLHLDAFRGIKFRRLKAACSGFPAARELVYLAISRRIESMPNRHLFNDFLHSYRGAPQEIKEQVLARFTSEVRIAVKKGARNMSDVTRALGINIYCLELLYGDYPQSRGILSNIGMKQNRKRNAPDAAFPPRRTPHSPNTERFSRGIRRLFCNNQKTDNRPCSLPKPKAAIAR